jgi:hypothetical protein
VEGERFDLDLLDEEDPFEIDSQAAHLFKHPHLGIDDIDDVWASDPLFYPAKPPAHWLMCAEVGGRVLVVRWLPRAAGTGTDAVRSAVMRRRTGLLLSTGETDDENAYDTRRGIRFLRAAGKPGAPGTGPSTTRLPARPTRAGAVPPRVAGTGPPGSRR